MDARLSPTERLIVMSLSLNPNQTEAELLRSTASKTAKHVNRSLRTLQIANLVVADVRAGLPTTYNNGGGK
jgi:pyridoxal/pyridoxine/pyridoxamine kinase